MHYKEIEPGARLKPYVKCYYTYESDAGAAFEDTVFPSGCMEMIFNLGDGLWQTATQGDFVTHPAIELWGQLLRPLPVRSVGKHNMLGVRFFPHAAAFFLNDKADLFNDRVTDYRHICGSSAGQLHNRLLETVSWQQRIALVEDFLWQQLLRAQSRTGKVTIVGHVMQELNQPGFFDNIENVAARYGITSRYLQKLFLQYTGLTPKLYSKIHRFQNSLQLVIRKEDSLTAIAYDCGYFDQSHFIREFKSFTGFTPSGYSPDQSPVTLATVNS
ncbi:helix-turn-helix transcriptional regulator [Chitinophaga sp. HK235]|uniref:helix-turn-helix transcriptional regulator n=1 Tax=Chitinophaga sp. HK235 TaxID=2952571 RepID=UPI001BAC2B45|nr:helix-turn-helix transcriptional regulator [Chitinophaga sp. HK235]